jgi:hypothetical protein
MKLLIVFIIILLLSTVAEAVPVWTQNSVSVPTGSQYSPARDYGFQINWTDPAGISKVILEMNGDSYTAFNTGDMFYYNLTGLAAGPYSYRWFANNTAGESAYSDQFAYNVEKNSSASFVLSLNGTEGNRSYSRYWIANFTAVLNIPGKTIFLDSNYPGFSVYDENSTIYYVINLTTEGFFSLSSVWNGDDNYTGTSKTYYFDTSPPQYSNIVSSPSDFATYAPDAIYYFNITWTDASLTEVRFESNFSGSKKNYTKSTNPKVYNESNLFWINMSNIDAKDFVYTWYAKDSLGNWTGTNQKIYGIFKGYALNLYSPFTEVPNGTTTVFNCYSLTDEIDTGDFKFYRNSTLINNTTTLSRSDVSVLPVGFYQYVCNTTGNKNYNNQTLKSNLTVTPPETEKPIEIKEFKITNVSSPSIDTGKTGQGTFNLSSTLDDTVTGITVTLVGIDPEVYTINNVPSALLKGGSALIRINFDIPSVYETGLHNITVRVTGNLDGSTIAATAYMLLTVNSVAPPGNIPPSYTSVLTESLDDKVLFSFSLYDDREVSGYIFSTNYTGTWVNDSWVPVDEALADVSFEKPLQPTTGIAAWKFYFNDSNDAWSASEEYYLAAVGGFDYTVLIIVIMSFAALGIVLFFLQKMRNREPEKKAVYVYSKEDR